MYQIDLAFKRIRSPSGVRNIAIGGLTLAFFWAVLLELVKSQSIPAFTAVKDATLIPFVFFAGVLYAVASGADSWLVTTTFFLVCTGVGVQSLLDPGYIGTLKVLYLLGAGAAAVTALLWPRLQRCRCKTLEVGGLAFSFLLFAAMRASPPVNGSYLALQIGGHSFQLSGLLSVTALIVLAAALNDETEPYRCFHSLLILLYHAILYISLNELGTLAILIAAYVCMVIAALPVREYLGWFLAIAFVLAAGWVLLRHVGPQAGGLLGTIYHKVAARTRYTNLTDLQSLSSEELYGGAFQTVAAMKVLLLSQFWGPSPYNKIYVPVLKSDYIACAIINRAGLAAVFFVAFALFVLFALGVAGSKRSSGMAAILAVGAVGALTASGTLNLLGACNLVPFTGVCLPFASAGGANLICSMCLVMFILHGTIRTPNNDPNEERSTL